MTKTFINLPVTDLTKSTAFYTAIWFTLNPQFSNADASGLAFDESIYVMLLTHAFFKSFLPGKEIADTHKVCAVMNSLDRTSRAEVDVFMDKVLAAGGTEYRQAYDHGFMYGRAFEDPDGHIREIFWMDPTQQPQQ